QALDLHMRLRAWRRQEESLQATLDQLADGVVLLDAASRVLFCNRAATELVAQRDGLEIVAGELLPRASWAAGDLGRAVARALQTRAGEPVDADGEILAPRADGRPALILAVRPLPQADSMTDDLYADAPQPAVAVFIQDPARGAATAARILRDVFKLTPAETRLAVALYRGLTLKSYAADHDISINTVRSHLARAMRKTDTRRQADLIRLINTIDLPAR
ncbi:MAG: helix-turn-helix transcriptional regulator, partial [Hyphomicrobiales bacterium]|nr:helix-turn-helix transcriptional regulator [Hyphomicrobiales bacterium]